MRAQLDADLGDRVIGANRKLKVQPSLRCFLLCTQKITSKSQALSQIFVDGRILNIIHRSAQRSACNHDPIHRCTTQEWQVKIQETVVDSFLILELKFPADENGFSKLCAKSLEEAEKDIEGIVPDSNRKAGQRWP